jgi:putative transposase of IS4/5 family DUF4096
MVSQDWRVPNHHYATDVSDAAWALLAPLLPAAQPGGRRRTTDIRAVINAIFYLMRTGCQWRLLPREFPAWAPCITIFGYGRTPVFGLVCDGPCMSKPAGKLADRFCQN